MDDDDTPIYIQMDRRGKSLKYSDHKMACLARSLNKWVDQAIEDGKSFLLGDWCFANGVIPQKLKFYSDRHHLLKKAYLRAKSWQEHMITKGALYKKLDPKMSTFMLTCVHDWDPKKSQNQQPSQQMTVIHYGNQQPQQYTSAEREVQAEDDDEDGEDGF